MRTRILNTFSIGLWNIRTVEESYCGDDEMYKTYASRDPLLHGIELCSSFIPYSFNSSDAITALFDQNLISSEERDDLSNLIMEHKSP